MSVGDIISLSGWIICGRDAALPRLVAALEAGEDLGIDVRGQAVFHTAFSRAGIGPTSSNKVEIESSIAPLSSLGVKLHLGKGALGRETVEALECCGSVYAVVPPVTALLGKRTLGTRCAAFPELGMEALYMIRVERFPAMVAAARGRSVYDRL